MRAAANVDCLLSAACVPGSRMETAPLLTLSAEWIAAHRSSLVPPQLSVSPPSAARSSDEEGIRGLPAVQRDS